MNMAVSLAIAIVELLKICSIFGDVLFKATVSNLFHMFSVDNRQF